MNIVYSSDENYAQHLCVSLVSLLENNKEDLSMNLFIISNKISDASKDKISDVAKRYGKKIEWIDFLPFQSELNLDMEWPISISSYARLFIAEMLPAWCKKVIYLDCDTVVCSSLSGMWAVEMKNCSVAGVEDLIQNEFKEKIGMNLADHYINAGILLIDLQKWREKNQGKLFLDFINDYKGRVTHHDQGVINGTLHQECLILPPQYNVMTPFFTKKYNDIRSFYQLSQYYSEEEIQRATTKPVIIHYTPECVGRVWEYDCKHPKVDLYRKYLDLTPWKGNLMHAKKIPLKLHFLYWMQKNLPITVISFLLKFKRAIDTGKKT